MKILIFLLLMLLPALSEATDLADCGTLSVAGTYVLQNDVSSNGTCFTVTSNNVVLNLNGHRIVYDNQVPVTIPNSSFESELSGNWDLTNAPNAERAAGTYTGTTVSAYEGAYAMRFALPATDQYFESIDTVTLAANTTYSLSAMFRNSGNNETTENASNATRDPLQLSVELTGTTYKGTATGITWRGFQYTNVVFTTGAAPVAGKIRISIANATTAGIKGYAYVDDVKILKANSYGVNLGPNYAGANGFTITNGTIVQGQGNGFASHAINMGESAGTGWSIDHLAITTQGANSKAISGFYFKNATINYNTIHHNVTTIKSRDNYDGAAIYLPYASSTGSYNSTIHHNTFVTGVQTAISVAQTAGQIQNQIYNNDITLQTKYTNDFAISASGSIIRDNTINCGSGDNSCRGIVINGESTKAYNNIVNVQQLPRNQEYNGCEMAGAYGMQMEYAANNVEVYGNTVTAYGGECEAHALRANPNVALATNNLIHDNVFTALANGSGRAASIKFSELNASALNVYGNTFRTNHRWIYLAGEGAVTNPTFTNNRWETTGTLPAPFQPFEVFTWANSHFTGTFYGNTYGTGDQARFESEYFRISTTMERDTSSIIYINGLPTTDIYLPITTVDKQAGRYQSKQTVTLSCADNSKCSSTSYCVSLLGMCTPATAYTIPITGILKNIAHQWLCTKSIDSLDNVEVAHCYEYKKQIRK